MQVQEKIVRVQKKRLITIPKVFEDVGFEENSLARITKVKGKLVLEPVRTLPYKVRTYTSGEVEEFLGLDREESKQLRDEGLL